MMVGVILLLRATNSSTMAHHRSPTSEYASTTTPMANATQRKSSTRTADKTWPVSTCHERYQKHAAVTNSLTATIASFLVVRPRDRCVVLRSLAPLVLI